MLLERRIDVVTFTSPSAVLNFVHVLGAEPAADLLNTTLVASIGPVTAEAAALAFTGRPNRRPVLGRVPGAAGWRDRIAWIAAL